MANAKSGLRRDCAPWHVRPSIRRSGRLGRSRRASYKSAADVVSYAVRLVFAPNLVLLASYAVPLRWFDIYRITSRHLVVPVSTPYMQSRSPAAGSGSGFQGT